MKVITVVVLCLVGAITIQGRPAKLADSKGEYGSTQSTSEDFLKISEAPADESSAEYSSEDVPLEIPSPVQFESPSVVQEKGQEEEEGNEEESQNTLASHHVPILVNLRQRQDDGAYSFRVEQGDGIRRSESGAARGPNGEWHVVGEYSFMHPDGTHHELTYVADQNGFHPSSDMLPQPHPLEPWHLEQIAFAESQKLKGATEEEGLSEKSSDETNFEVAASDVTSGFGAGVANDVTVVGAESTGAGNAGTGATGVQQSIFVEGAGVADTRKGNSNTEISRSSALTISAGFTGVADTEKEDSAAEATRPSVLFISAGNSGATDNEIANNRAGATRPSALTIPAGNAEATRQSASFISAGNSGATDNENVNNRAGATRPSALTIPAGNAGVGYSIIGNSSDEDIDSSNLAIYYSTQNLRYAPSSSEANDGQRLAAHGQASINTSASTSASASALVINREEKSNSKGDEDSESGQYA